MSEEIKALDVGGLNGEFYKDIRAYVEKQGCKWEEERGPQGNLLSVKLTFPPGAMCEKLPPPDKKYESLSTVWERRKISFRAGGILYWSIKKTEPDINHINVPYVYLA